MEKFEKQFEDLDVRTNVSRIKENQTFLLHILCFHYSFKFSEFGLSTRH